MNIHKLRKLAGQEEIDYQFIVSALKDYARPREKISAWLKSGELIRIKKGLYIFGQDAALQAYSKEILANQIYGPSAISLTYALAYYGLIPERVNIITCITNKRFKSFSTCVGEFKYYYLNDQKYAPGIKIQTSNSQQSFLIASPEKALCDQIHIIDKEVELKDINDLKNYLFHDLRLDPAQLLTFKLKNIKELCEVYNDHKIELLYQYIKNRT